MNHSVSERVTTPTITLGTATITVTFEIHVVVGVYSRGSIGHLEAVPRTVTVTSSRNDRPVVLAVSGSGTSD